MNDKYQISNSCNLNIRISFDIGTLVFELVCLGWKKHHDWRVTSKQAVAQTEIPLSGH